jgi:hypothetical protein
MIIKAACFIIDRPVKIILPLFHYKIPMLHLFMDEVEHQTAIRIWSGKLSIDKVTTPKGKTINLYSIPFYYAGMSDVLLSNA